MLQVSAPLQSLRGKLCTRSIHGQHMSVTVIGMVCGHARGLRSCKRAPCVLKVVSWSYLQPGCLPIAGTSLKLQSSWDYKQPGLVQLCPGQHCCRLSPDLCCAGGSRSGPRPLGNDGALPLISSTADIFHIVNPHGATFIRDNFFVNLGAALSLQVFQQSVL